ncbi:DUF202 domain-containing protein [Buttiauxella selenatireducens]|uniref:DUF202 domain-containing protein n=1 Tax=Buttiauxella selenatireducens TaxID=3073902 RepID=A0ABY9SIA5_9ENTR|nr:DUF202 domain-containing protein [Buttiauxella sp. R73]WMY76733.1 DUF202 domain-containing protein [Buttiauxella sp. R73]
MAEENEKSFPDYRFTLANERTFLAWIRTALAFMASAVGIDQLTTHLAPTLYRLALVVLLGVTSAGLSFYAYRRWAVNETAMRHAAELPFPRILIWISSGLFVTVLLTLVLMVVV